MTQPANASTRVRFGIFELDLTTGELRRKGVKVALQEQPFQVLAMLVEAPGELVTREALRERLWKDSVFVDFDHGLNKAVAKIRAALGDLAESPRYVETLERRGYRFIAPVEPVAGAPGGVASAARPTTTRLVWGDRSMLLGEGTHVIGRDPSAAVWIDSPIVSKRHAAVVVAADSVTVEDLGSHNGTFVNGTRLHGAMRLGDGDEIRVGSAVITVHTLPPEVVTLTSPSLD